ncbi:fumarate reductase/succinate dehydrogenase flavoprotein domain-containing protein [Paenibacillus mucilaginosus 3016]|uniref:Fumarate reductase/succinate dehydrogenase flavoprotein domain-containing protein n=2 Tax=Paenibacillus mucilaginosus TaxID=61624 RepID=H6NFT6_9BACL|nr:fumarate reductase/succinate dehydrogenase flavoprotein domain-containing protein [Paenibacillus mucilaginosus 3016]
MQTVMRSVNKRMSGTQGIEFTADVLVIGGGPAGAWAAWSAAREGAKVVLADKGYLGSSGATAPGGTNLLVLPPDRELRDAAVRQRVEASGYLAEERWIHRVLDQVYTSLLLVESWGYPFVRDENGTPMRNHLQGPEYMKLMRRAAAKAGVRILDQSPALELLRDEHGAAGARGVSRLDGREWTVRAHAVVIATGGCAFLSKGLGCNVLTGEGLLMSAELGAELSGMEFTRQYAPSAAFGTVTRGRLLNWATLYDEEGQELEGHGNRGGLHRLLHEGKKVFAVMDKADTEEKRSILRQSHAIFFLPYDRAGIDPFTQPFPLTLRYEGTVRGTGGLRLTEDDCSTTVPGLYAAGDAATRERVTGAISGGGAYNASWAISSGTWAGAGAARYALSQGRDAGQRLARPAGTAGTAAYEAGAAGSFQAQDVIEGVQREVFPLGINYYRSVPVLKQSLQRLDALWSGMGGAVPDTVQARVRSREAAAMAAAARWMYSAALGRRETRGMHTLAEYPQADPLQQHRLIVSGIGGIRLRPEAVPGSPAVRIETLQEEVRT